MNMDISSSPTHPPDLPLSARATSALTVAQSLLDGECPARDNHLADAMFSGKAFWQLLNWLDPDAEAAGQRYEGIRHKLITIFRYKGCADPEELADETINRVVRKLPNVLSSYAGDPALYFYAVAKRIYLEYRRRAKQQPLVSVSVPSPETRDHDTELLLERLDEALGTLSQSDRELILRYYDGGGQRRIDQRKALAEQMGLPPNALRLRVFRIRSRLRDYVLETCSTRSDGKS